VGWNLNDYEPVEERLAKFWDHYPPGRVETELVAHEGNRFIVAARLYRMDTDPQPFATGLAEETISDRGVNSTSALENAETSAIGRALANAGISPKGKRPSREESQQPSAVKSWASSVSMATCFLKKAHPRPASRITDSSVARSRRLNNAKHDGQSKAITVNGCSRIEQPDGRRSNR